MVLFKSLPGGENRTIPRKVEDGLRARVHLKEQLAPIRAEDLCQTFHNRFPKCTASLIRVADEHVGSLYALRYFFLLDLVDGGERG